MLQPAIEILDSQGIMSISTLRPDGWPPTTVVGYANEEVSGIAAGWGQYVSRSVPSSRIVIACQLAEGGSADRECGA